MKDEHVAATLSLIDLSNRVFADNLCDDLAAGRFDPMIAEANAEFEKAVETSVLLMPSANTVCELKVAVGVDDNALDRLATRTARWMRSRPYNFPTRKRYRKAKRMTMRRMGILSIQCCRVVPTESRSTGTICPLAA